MIQVLQLPRLRTTADNQTLERVEGKNEGKVFNIRQGVIGKLSRVLCRDTTTGTITELLLILVTTASSKRNQKILSTFSSRADCCKQKDQFKV